MFVINISVWGLPAQGSKEGHCVRWFAAKVDYRRLNKILHVHYKQCNLVHGYENQCKCFCSRDGLHGYLHCSNAMWTVTASVQWSIGQTEK